MSNQLPVPVESPGDQRKPRKTLPVFVVVAIAGLVALVVGGGWLYLRSGGQDTTGLEGTWRMGNNARHIHEFRRTGELACWLGSSKEWWFQLGWSATWKREGQQITIRTDRHWDFKGELDGDTIRGKMLLKSPAGVVEQEVDTVWTRE